LPGWVYHDPEYFRVEMARLIRPAWQIVCHANDIPDAGDWRTLDIAGESILVIRGGDRAIRAFANVCRHRGSRLVDGEAGCAKRLDRKSTRLNSSHSQISYAVFCLKKKSPMRSARSFASKSCRC